MEGAAHGIHFSLSVWKERYKQLNRFYLILLWGEKYVCVYKAFSARCLLLSVLVPCVYYFISSALKGSRNKTIDSKKHGNVILLHYLLYSLRVACSLLTCGGGERRPKIAW